ncbi:BTAD domain-containing putative transcriptional regulator [Streptosporangium sp. G11]|uniref:BTAD domain-containing putative transcriptional regulator n=1 Tax=Streptosporangium sp. G11 TaxID=3436926 RepID=UPI003EB8053F
MTIHIRVLGSFHAEVNGAPVPLSARLPRAVLCRLILARGDVVSVDRLIDDLWRSAPPSQAIASLQSYMANLRRAIEPDRPPRAPARVLISAAPGYAARLQDDAVDAWLFERLVREARERSGDDPAHARTLLTDALALWRGEAFAEVADEPWAVSEVARLEELRQSARELCVAMTLQSAPAADAVPAAEMLTRRQPLREEGWRLLALALWGSDRQADALQALRRVRTTLVREIGLDPGSALVELENAILNQRTDLLHASIARHRPRTVTSPAPGAQAGPARPGATAADTPPGTGPNAPLFVGRTAELAALTRTADEVLAGARGIVLVTGEPGAGKSALLGRLRESLDPSQWLVSVGRCPETEGAPPAWAWLEALRPLASRFPPGEHEKTLAPLLGEAPLIEDDASAGRFRLHRGVCAWLRSITDGPSRHALAIVLDDLHKADTETIALLRAIVEQMGDARILLIAAFRSLEITEAQEEVLAVIARHAPARLHLDGLPAGDVERLVRSVCGEPVAPQTLASLVERTGGNPFYVWESARLLASEGKLSVVPDGVRDVLRRRLARLPAAAVGVLRLAAVVGREAEVEVLVNAADSDEDAVLDALEAGVFSGLLIEPSPGRVRFMHTLVRETLYQDLSQLRRTRMHARVADALRTLRPDDLTALAHHHAVAATSATAALAVDYSVRSAEVATRRYAHDTAAELLTQALDCFDRAAGQGDRDIRRVELLGKLVRAQVRAGAVVAARDTRARAIRIAEESGRDELLAAAFTSWTEATPWQIRPYGVVDAHAVDLLTRLLRRTDLDPATRCRLLEALAGELNGEGDPRSAAAAREAARLAEDLDEPTLTAMALTLLIKEADYEREADVRAPLAERLAAVAAEHDLVTHRWFAEFTAATTAAAFGDKKALRDRVERGMEIARTYNMPEALVVGTCAHAMLAHIAGRLDEAERLYDDAYQQMVRNGSIHARLVHGLALTTIRIGQGRIGEHEPMLRELHETTGPLVADALALALAATGRLEEARELRAGLPPLRRDFYHSVLATLRAMAVVALEDRHEARELMETLLPLRDVLPGASSNSLVARPMAHTLGELALLLGRDEEAAEHLTHAMKVARRWESPLWERQALERLHTMGRGRADLAEP